MTWKLVVPPDTAAVDVMHTLRELHAERVAQTERIDKTPEHPEGHPKGLPADEEDQINAAIRAVDILWHEVAKHDGDGNPIGDLHVALSGHASKGHKKGDTITISLSRPD